MNTIKNTIKKYIIGLLLIIIGIVIGSVLLLCLRHSYDLSEGVRTSIDAIGCTLADVPSKCRV